MLKKHKPDIRIAVVEPGESAVLSGGQPGPHKIEGVGIGYTPPLGEPSLVDEIVAVKTDDAKAMARRSRGKKDYSRGRRPAPMSSLRFRSGHGWVQAPPSSR